MNSRAPPTGQLLNATSTVNPSELLGNADKDDRLFVRDELEAASADALSTAFSLMAIDAIEMTLRVLDRVDVHLLTGGRKSRSPRSKLPDR